jgi:hypothetical protein
MNAATNETYLKTTRNPCYMQQARDAAGCTFADVGTVLRLAYGSLIGQSAPVAVALVDCNAEPTDHRV